MIRSKDIEYVPSKDIGR